MKQTQKEMVLDYIERFGSITPLEALTELGCYRLATRIFELKAEGYNIVTKMIKVPKKMGGYANVAKYYFGE